VDRLHSNFTQKFRCLDMIQGVFGLSPSATGDPSRRSARPGVVRALPAASILANQPCAMPSPVPISKESS
jgi:hypothetical protein